MPAVPPTDSYDVPKDLSDAIRAGRCVAFVGSGFSQPTMPSWHGLLEELTNAVPDGERRGELTRWLGRDDLTNRDYEGIAQTVKEELGYDFHETLAQTLRRELRPETGRRRTLLYEIPFHLVLTTNFDGVIEGGRSPSATSFGAALTAPVRPWWSADCWGKRGHGTKVSPPPHGRVIALHGDVTRTDGRSDSRLVFTTRDYRNLVHETPGYRSFLRTVFATNTVLYLGFSFTDAYVSELRSEVMSMLGPDAARGQDYAVLEDVEDLTATHYAEHEGLVPLRFDSGAPDDADSRSWDGFDRWLEAIHRETSPEATLRRKLGATHILWFDPRPRNNDRGYRVLTGQATDDGPVVESVTTLEQAKNRLKENNGRASLGEGYGLVITHFGGDRSPEPNAVALLRYMRDNDLRAPVIVFASGHRREDNRPLVMSLGALAYTHTWPELFMHLDRLVSEREPPELARR